MQRRDLIIGAVVLAVIAGVVLFIQRRRQEVGLPASSPISTPTIQEQEEAIEDRFRVDIPENVEKANLKDVQGRGFSGIATRDVKSGVLSMTVLADLPDPAQNKFYQVWLRKGADARKLGSMNIAKGGFLLDVDLREDLSTFKEVVVSLESKNDAQIEEVILQGSF
ncbi:hypothetical protein A2125_02105 [Candidatus Woesebacteria bacterium GWB1_43_5]|uniref:Anti-sigma K factor RskA C-terminal domain-containing protein n=1 Tax=Candidatus Woesebacteria bacterium GWB1_43_5 TaxID=1802474 RepID=A0A1F7WSD3_9BACT|nr:MAG: hypothetical protein A2125_02105 [Candidatus Woesebacteria bacterium GWB1_43_5]